MHIETLTKLEYSTDLRGPWLLYIFDQEGYHYGGQWFAREIRYPKEQITIATAKEYALSAIAKGREVRVCDGGDMLVFHSVDGKQLYPVNEVDFWASIEATKEEK